MWADGARKKKLIVAFHFQFANQAAWECDSCRESGFEAKRRCGFVRREDIGNTRVVWARGRVTCDECPVSLISSDSQNLLEEFHAWKLFGHQDYTRLPARVVEAIAVLENEWRTETRNAQA